MTRFARAKGSKASNERVPDEPTPWHVMKQQLDQSVAAKQFQEPKTKSAKELLRERDDLYYGDIGNQNNDWAEFEPEKKTPNKNTVNNQTPAKKDKKNKKVNSEVKENTEINGKVPCSSEESKKSKAPIKSDSTIKENTESSETNSSPLKKSKKRKSDVSNDEVSTTTPKIEGISEKGENEGQKKKKKKKTENEELKKDVSGPPQEKKQKTESEETEKSQPADGPTGKLSKRQKRNRKNKLKNSDQNDSNANDESNKKPGAFNTEGNEWTSDVKFGNKNESNNDDNNKSNEDNKNPRPPKQDGDNNGPPNRFERRPNGPPGPQNRFQNQNVVNKRKPPKIRDDKEHKRRKPNPGIQKVIINGMEVEIVLYDGFPVKKDDADRLIELRKQMIMKGIPKSEINAAMKLERRKAEKNLTRIKKNVCFHCRKAGHNLSDCPELGQEEKATGICFKCGSGEHTHFECKVTKKDDFGFAKCFICREQGHIAKQCPDNPKGLYPQGGACKICGDVTHLKKDCPDLAKEKEENTLTVDTISDAVDSLECDRKVVTHSDKPKQKIVTF
uniref:CCHC-type domain-containing protein n=1 Tax=Bracon brevicornis TaxID=1563983 RepID=A0A6V7IYW2_9HYME